MTKSAKVREQLDHPVIDADGHWVELFPVFFDYIAEVGSPADVDTFRARYGHRFHGWYELTVEERRRATVAATVVLGGADQRARPRRDRTARPLLRQPRRAGASTSPIVFPSVGLTLGRDIADPELSNVAIRAYNTMVADLFSPYLDRMVPVGVLSLAEPTEAIEQLEHAHALGLKVLVTGGTIPRTIEADAEWQPDPAKRRVYIDALGVDSPYDYDPVWQKFVDLGIPVTSHSGSHGLARPQPVVELRGQPPRPLRAEPPHLRPQPVPGRRDRTVPRPSTSASSRAASGGRATSTATSSVTGRSATAGSWTSTSSRPTSTPRSSAGSSSSTPPATRATRARSTTSSPGTSTRSSPTRRRRSSRERDLDSDDFARVHIEGPDDIRRLFARNFYFGCEADDPMTSIAFNEKMGLQLKPLLGSDIAHFDVIDATEVLEEAYELVEHGHITEHNFREFTFSNVVQLYRGMNPEFFTGTVVEAEAEAEFAKYQGSAAVTYDTIVSRAARAHRVRHARTAPRCSTRSTTR